MLNNTLRCTTAWLAWIKSIPFWHAEPKGGICSLYRLLAFARHIWCAWRCEEQYYWSEGIGGYILLRKSWVVFLSNTRNRVTFYIVTNTTRYCYTVIPRPAKYYITGNVLQLRTHMFGTTISIFPFARFFIGHNPGLPSRSQVNREFQNKIKIVLFIYLGRYSLQIPWPRRSK